MKSITVSNPQYLSLVGSNVLYKGQKGKIEIRPFYTTYADDGTTVPIWDAIWKVGIELVPVSGEEDYFVLLREEIEEDVLLIETNTPLKEML
mgnify:CR=1 FL=1